MSAVQRLELLLFTACLFAFAYFHQGGGWNQNARFAEVRAMAEEGRFAIDNFLIYQRDAVREDLQRVPVQDAEFTWEGKRQRLAWVDMAWNLFPVNDTPLAEGVTPAPMIELCASGDIAYNPATGHFHPNKPPGTSFLALPGYFVIHRLERALGINPDQWWVLTLNHWLTTVCSVGLVSAFGCVLFFRLARELAGGAALPAVFATLAFAFGTTFFPFATILFDHNLTASLLIAAFYFARPHSGADFVFLALGEGKLTKYIKALPLPVAESRLAFAGLCAGAAAVTNYIAAVAVIFLGLYVLLAIPARLVRIGAVKAVARPQTTQISWRRALFFSLGVVPPFLLICWYGYVCFGSPFALNTDFQNPLFKDPAGALGMFALPSAYVALLISITPFRGIFFLAPVLLLSFYGLYVWLREKTYAPEARLCLAILGFFFLVNASFNGYHGGFSAGPRYLIPALPFLALPLVVAFARWPRITCAFAMVSIFNQLLLTITDAQNPLAVGGHARNDRKPDALNRLVGDYAWPLFAHERAWPMLDQLMEVHMEKEIATLEAEFDDAAEVERRAELMRRDLRESMVRGEPSPFLLASVVGPVSVNPIGVYDGLFTYRIFQPHTPPTRWASFNVGEFLSPQSRWSLLPLMLISGGLCGWAALLARREDAADAVLAHCSVSS